MSNILKYKLLVKRSVKWPYSIQWDPIEMFLLQTHLLFVTTFGLAWSSSVNIRWFWSIWKFPITAHPILCSNVTSLNLMKVVSPFGKNSIPHWASFWNQVMPFRIDGNTDIYNLIFLILKDMYDNTISKRYMEILFKEFWQPLLIILYLCLQCETNKWTKLSSLLSEGTAPRRTSLNRKFH